MNVEAKLEALFYFQTLKGKPPIFTLAFPLISANTCSFNTLVIFLTTYLAILLGTTFIPAEVLVNKPSHLPKKSTNPTSSLILRCFLQSLFQKYSGKHFVSTTSTLV